MRLVHGWACKGTPLVKVEQAAQLSRALAPRNGTSKDGQSIAYWATAFMAGFGGFLVGHWVLQESGLSGPSLVWILQGDS